MKYFAMVVIFATASLVQAADTENPSGMWANENSILRITLTDGSLSAVVAAILNPTYTEGESDRWPTGSERRDDNNPDESLRPRPLIGIDLLRDFRFEKGRWRGELYDPESGNWYSAHITVTRDGNLKMRGYIGAPMFGRTAEFIPAASCTESVLLMVAQNPVVDC